MAARHLQAVHALFELSEEQEPLERFIIALKWYLSHLHEGEAAITTRKPFNPVLDEVHHAWVDYKEPRNQAQFAKHAKGGNAPDSWSTFVGEQVSHHPPVTAWRIENAAHGLRLDCSAGFQVRPPFPLSPSHPPEVRFGSNSASVVVLGPLVVSTGKDTFVVSQSVPNLTIKNVVWGTKYIMYEGKFELYSPESGYRAEINMVEEEGERNAFSGTIWRHTAPVYAFSGTVGRHGDLYPVADPATTRRFFDMSKHHSPTVSYLPPKQQLPFESMRVWARSNKAIIDNDVVLADEEKKKVEAEQRLRQRAKHEGGKEDEARYFRRKHVAGVAAGHEGAEGEEHAGAYTLNKATLDALAQHVAPPLEWEFRENFRFQSAQLSSLEAEAVAANAERARLEEEARQRAEAEGAQAAQEGNCLVQ